MLIPHGTMIAVLDGRAFELWRNVGDEANPELASLPSPRLDTHNHSAGSHHGGLAVMTEDAHLIAAVAWLALEAQAHRLEHLVLVAPPRALGEARKHYTRPLEQALRHELAKDLAGRKGPEILAQLRSK